MNPKPEISTLTQMMDAVNEGDAVTFRDIIHRHPEVMTASLDPVSPEYNGSTILHVLANIGNTEMGEIALDALGRQGVSVNDLRDRDSNRPQHWAAQNGHLAFMKLLREHGADFMVENLLRTMPIYDASYRGHPDVVGYIIDEQGPKTYLHRNEYMYDPLTVAIGYIYFRDDCVEAILSRMRPEMAEKYINTPNPKGYNALDLLEQNWLKHQRLRVRGTNPPLRMSQMPGKEEEYARAKAVLEKYGAKHTELWNSQTNEERATHVSRSIEPVFKYRHLHSTRHNER